MYQCGLMKLYYLSQIQKPFFSLLTSLQVLLDTGNLPKTEVLFGLNKDEATFFLVYALPGYSITGQSLITRTDFLHGAAIAMSGSSNVTQETATFQYTDWTDENDGAKNRDLLGSLVGDQLFNCPLLEFAQR